MATSNQTDRLQEVIVALKQKGFSSSAEEDGSLLVKVGINAQLLYDLMKKESLGATNLSPGESAIGTENWGTLRVGIRRGSDKDIFLDVVDEFCQSYAIAFDLDGTLVDSSASFDAVVAELVLRHSGKPMPPEELQSLRAEGGFNNNWDASVELIKRRGKVMTREQIDPEALEIYFSLAEPKEKLIAELATLAVLKQRHPLYIFTRPAYFRI